ncbi:MAG: pyridine nucleotide-disulfide oxidoreductase family protein [Betaproteobacteria bacterium]|nr:pyridine nucleotide-disulfide oxidoreductase family protein [Betaproteobacteria bacterium]
MNDFDVIVVGGGNAAFAAAISAREHGAKRVLVLEKAPKAQRGGNTHFSGAIFRHYFNDVKELDRFVPDAEEKYPGFHAGCESYPKEAFRADLMRVTGGRSDPELSTILIDESYDTLCWIQEKGGMEFELAHSVMGVRVNGKIKWPKGAIVRVVHEGVGLSKTWFETAEQMGIETRYDTSAMRLTQAESARVNGVVARGPDGISNLNAKAVILAAGGFETNPAWRRLYLGDPWDHAKVRGSNFNYGDGLKMAMDIGAMPWGHWGGCHATPINALAPDYGRRDLTDKTNRLSYTYGVMINVEGKRWVDEGADFNSYTYAKYGGMILKQPRSLIYQIFDSKVLDMLEPRYSTSEPFKSDTLEGLVKQLDLDQAQAIKTLNEYNAAAGHGKFDPIALDGLHTKGIEPAKTNWAQKLDKPPYVAYPVTGGITFTFGGLKITKDAQVVGTDWKPMPGLYTCGEMVGGLFHYNYPLGTGLMSGAVFGRIAGRSAARS